MVFQSDMELEGGNSSYSISLQVMRCRKERKLVSEAEENRMTDSEFHAEHAYTIYLGTRVPRHSAEVTDGGGMAANH